MTIDSFTEVTRTSLGRRLSSSIIMAPVGILLFLGSFILLSWNEGRAVDRMRTLAEGRSLVVAVSSEAVDTGNNEALVHITGKANSDEILGDDLFGVSINAIVLRRIVEMYQWKEERQSKTHTNSDGSQTTTTTYSYRKTWSPEVIDSTNFKRIAGHENPGAMMYEGSTQRATDVQVGAFTLTEPFVVQLNDARQYPLSEKNYAAMDPYVRQFFQLQGGRLVSDASSQPAIGALRVSFQVVEPTNVSVVGQQKDGRIETFYTSNGEIEMLRGGTMGAEQMFSAAESDNTFTTWGLRLGGLVMMWIGISMILGPITLLSGLIPFVGTILNSGIALVSGFAAFVLSGTTIMLAWISFRPLIGGTILLIVVFVAFGGIGFVGRRLRAAAAPTAGNAG